MTPRKTDDEKWEEITKKEKLPIVVNTPTSIDDILKERGERYGKFKEHARITQEIKKALTSGRNWGKLTPSQKEALEMNAHKMGRIVNGDPTYLDSWDDIIGYIKLVTDELRGHEK